MFTQYDGHSILPDRFNTPWDLAHVLDTEFARVVRAEVVEPEKPMGHRTGNNGCQDLTQIVHALDRKVAVEVPVSRVEFRTHPEKQTLKIT